MSVMKWLHVWTFPPIAFAEELPHVVIVYYTLYRWTLPAAFVLLQSVGGQSQHCNQSSHAFQMHQVAPAATTTHNKSNLWGFVHASDGKCDKIKYRLPPLQGIIVAILLVKIIRLISPQAVRRYARLPMKKSTFIRVSQGLAFTSISKDTEWLE